MARFQVSLLTQISEPNNTPYQMIRAVSANPSVASFQPVIYSHSPFDLPSTTRKHRIHCCHYKGCITKPWPLPGPLSAAPGAPESHRSIASVDSRLPVWCWHWLSSGLALPLSFHLHRDCSRLPLDTALVPRAFATICSIWGVSVRPPPLTLQPDPSPHHQDE